MLVKNTYGCSAVLGTNLTKRLLYNKYSGSSLDRKKESNPKPKKKEVNEEAEELKLANKKRSMSSRTKTKIRKKLMAFAQLHKRLTFVTLTFSNEVTDELAVVVLRKFIDNIKKRSKDFQYLWVAERQTGNKTFSDNIHFHLITNKYWDIQKTWGYWLEVQKKNGILPREQNFKASSAFDVKKINTSNLKQVGVYLTKYVTKNKAEFKCQVWNCSKSISALYTDFYTDYSFLEELHRLKRNEIKEIPLEYCTLHLIPLDKTTIRFYDRLENKNRKTLRVLD
ncbi:rolling circle replication-associated protein [Rufibacter roseus]|uniref:rolling circle replication-associated protein n=1 Tax=Rufibacter roseus TaxID=1567108 RepID=UPI00082E5984|nr:hypothetical protein [Rufibacter roseus]